MSAAVEHSHSPGSAVTRLKALVDAPDRFDLPCSDLLQTQLQAADELFRDRVGRIRLLQNRAETAGIKAIHTAAEIVPLLFAHTAYKSYPENWLVEQKWDRLCKWLDTVSTYRVKPTDPTRVRDIDDWIEQLSAAGHHVSCSSGTGGKSAMLIASAADLEWSAKDSVYAYSWGANVRPAQDRRMFGLAPVASVPRNLAIRDAMARAFGEPDAQPFIYPVPPITIGKVTGMVALRKRIADGTARPGEIADFEATSAARQQAIDAAAQASAEALVRARQHKLALSGMWAALHKVAELVRAMGYSGKDFDPENTIYIGGGLKGAVLPPNYREYVFETFNLAPEHVMQMYGMQEIGSAMPRCKAGRYHVPPWLMCLVLDDGGDQLLTRSSGEIEGRAAFFDIALDGRWNGVISGDKISVDYGRCACGNASPSIRDSITRYADTASGDKITCSGTIDAYVRGVA